MNINIRNSTTFEWSSSTRDITPSMRDAYACYKDYVREMPHVSQDWIVYRPDNDSYLPTYIVRRSEASLEHYPMIDYDRITSEIHEMMENNQVAIPIIDINDIYVFLTDHPPNDPNWLPARSYQIWAYRDYVYDRNHSVKKSYMTRGTQPFVYENNVHMLANQIVTIDLGNILPNIAFNISRNVNNSVYFERNDTARTRVRICDSQIARNGYLGFYNHITMDTGMIINYLPENGLPSSSPNLLSVAHFSALEEIDGDDGEHGEHGEQCILCVRYRVNTRFSPCEHQVCCSDCYSKMSKNECPICRAKITLVTNI